jgi:hypothetical protein
MEVLRKLNYKILKDITLYACPVFKKLESSGI